MKNKKNNVINPRLNALEKQINGLQNQIDGVQFLITCMESRYKRETHQRNVAQSIKDLETLEFKSYEVFVDRLSNLKVTLINATERFNLTEKEIDKAKKELKNAAAASITLKPTNKRKLGKISNAKFSPSYLTGFKTDTVSFEADWENVNFGDGFIIIKYNEQWYRRAIGQSKKYLNEIKHFYRFHGVPRLRVTINGSLITLIENQEVLFYHIDFFKIAASNFGFIESTPLVLENWKRYTKLYFKKSLPFAFHTYSLKRLCEYCARDLPIIPVGEVVINSNGLKTIQNSFLFPMKSKKGYSIVWESVEEGKASYIFSVGSFADKDLQFLFDYIAGETPNKRQTLINSKSLQGKLKMKNRIFHTDMLSWEDDIQLLCK